LDVDFGTYNYITSSNATASGVSTGSGLPPMKLDRVLGVAKAYTTRVGEGPFPTELSDEIGERLRERGREYGATTGRPRRCGWFDAVAVRFTTMINGCESLAVTKLDVLDTEPVIKVCVAYEKNGTSFKNFPASLEALNKAKPVYEELPGWQEKISGATELAELPQKAKDYLAFLKRTLNTEISFISIGRERNQVIRL
jgi:adenylosuccinate synthase